MGKSQELFARRNTNIKIARNNLQTEQDIYKSIKLEDLKPSSKLPHHAKYQENGGNMTVDGNSRCFNIQINEGSIVNLADH